MDRIIAIAYDRALRNQRREKTSWFFMSKDFGQDHCRLEQCICSRDLIFQQASGFFSWMEFCQSRTKAPCFYPRNVAGSNDKVLRRQQRRKENIASPVFINADNIIAGSECKLRAQEEHICFLQGKEVFADDEEEEEIYSVSQISSNC